MADRIRCVRQGSERSLKALIVDDSIAMLARLSEIVNSAPGFLAYPFSDPLSALKAMKSENFDIVLVDYLMPQLDGIEVIRLIRSMPDYAAVPILMISGETDEEIRLKALEMGASDFIAKMISAPELKVRIQNLINLAIATSNLHDRAEWLAKAVENATQALLAREEEMIFRLSLAVEYRDNDTGGHTLRVATYSQIIAEEIGLAPTICRNIFLASPLHDVGKVAIPDAVLLKPGKLDVEEFEIVKGHSAIGERILGNSSSDLIRLAAEIAGAHHERWDGRGYPRGLAGRLIPLPARIVAVADVFDALTTERPYKRAMPVDEAFAHIEGESGKHFCPTCTTAFLSARDRIVDQLSVTLDRF